MISISFPSAETEEYKSPGYLKNYQNIVNSNVKN